jgi:hypothetical protein
MPNVLNREFSVTEPSKVWVSDITYIRVKKDSCTTVLDLYDRKIIGWSLSSGMSVKKLHWRLGEWLLKPKHHKGCYFILTEVFNTPVKFKRG